MAELTCCAGSNDHWSSLFRVIKQVVELHMCVCLHFMITKKFFKKYFDELKKCVFSTQSCKLFLKGISNYLLLCWTYDVISLIY